MICDARYSIMQVEPKKDSVSFWLSRGGYKPSYITDPHIYHIYRWIDRNSIDEYGKLIKHEQRLEVTDSAVRVAEAFLLENRKIVVDNEGVIPMKFLRCEQRGDNVRYLFEREDKSDIVSVYSIWFSYKVCKIVDSSEVLLSCSVEGISQKEDRDVRLKVSVELGYFILSLFYGQINKRGGK